MGECLINNTGSFARARLPFKYDERRKKLLNHSTIRESPSTRILGMILALVILALTLPISSAITEDEEPERIITMVDKANIYQYYTVFCAGSVVVAVPIVLLFIRLQKYYVAGVTGGATKG